MLAPGQNASRSGETPPSQDLGRPEATPLTDALQDQVVQTVVASSSDAVGLLFGAAGSSDSESSDELGNKDDNDVAAGQSTIDNILCPRLNVHEPVSPDILDLWNQHRFVRQGWFTALEAAAYVNA